MAEVVLITALVLILFFIFFVRPARQVQSRRRRDLNDLRIGDEVLTTGGLIATVVAVETPPTGPMVLHLELGEGVVVKARTSAIEERLRAAGQPADEDDALHDAGSDDAGSDDNRSDSLAGDTDPDDDDDRDLEDDAPVETRRAGGR